MTSAFIAAAVGASALALGTPVAAAQEISVYAGFYRPVPPVAATN